MPTRRTPSSKIIIGLAAVACLLALAAVPAHAQQSSAPGPPPPGDRDPFAHIRESQQREAQLRRAEMLGSARKTTDPRAAEAAAGQLRDDFKNIQVLRNKLVRQLKSDQPLDYKSLAGEVEEVSKRAGRLKSNLVREAAGDEKKETARQVEYDEEQMKDALARMCYRIDSFTGNPIFKAPDVVDAQQSAKAHRDLLDIIRLSGHIRRAAERLNKERQK